MTIAVDLGRKATTTTTTIPCSIPSDSRIWYNLIIVIIVPQKIDDWHPGTNASKPTHHALNTER